VCVKLLNQRDGSRELDNSFTLKAFTNALCGEVCVSVVAPLVSNAERAVKIIKNSLERLNAFRLTCHGGFLCDAFKSCGRLRMHRAASP
jgi:hypothetical protein